MAFIDTLLEQGYTLPGMPRRSINTDTGEIGFEETSTIGKFAKGLQSFMLQQQKEQEKIQKENLHKADMYKTLREAGYDSRSAYDATIKGVFPAEAGKETLKEQKEKTELSKITAETERAKAQTAKIQEETGLLKTGKKKIQITPSQALNIISDPVKATQFKNQYPQLYPKLEKLAQEALIGENEISDIEMPAMEELPAGITEEDIQFTMKKRNLTREEVIRRLKK